MKHTQTSLFRLLCCALSILLCCQYLISQNLLEEDFQSQLIPIGWTNIDRDLNTDANGRAMDWYVRADPQTSMPGDSNYVAASSSWFEPPGTADNWLITPALTITPTSTILSWKSAPQEGPAFMDGYEVLISTQTNDPADFTDVAATFAQGDATGNIIGPGIVHPTFQGNRGILSPWEVDLSPYIGKTIYIAFHHNSTNDNEILIDDVMVRSIQPDLEITLVHDFVYGNIPLKHSSCTDLKMKIKNTGTDTARNTNLNVKVYRKSNPTNTLINTNYSLGDVVHGDSLMIGDDKFFAEEVDTIIFEWTATTSDIDSDTSDNVIVRQVIITDDMLSRDNGIMHSFISLGNDTSIIFGQTFAIQNIDTLEGISFYAGADPLQVGQEVSGVLYSFDGVPNRMLGSTMTRIVEDPNAHFVNLPMNDAPVVLDPGTYFIGLKGGADKVRVAVSEEYFTPATGWAFVSGVWQTLESSFAGNQRRVPLIRAHLGIGSYARVVDCQDIQVAHDGTIIMDGDDIPSITDGTDFGFTCGELNNTFTITNTNQGTLILDSIVISAVGGNKGNFNFDDSEIMFPASLENEISADLIVTFDPTCGGPDSAMVRIYSNDADEAVFNFTVSAFADITDPVAICKNSVTVFVENGIVVLDPMLIDNGSSDNCFIDSYSVTPSSFDCSDVGSTQVVSLKVIDRVGNSSSCTANVMIEDAFVFPPVDIIGPTTICPSIDNVTYTISSSISYLDHQWSYSGTGVTISNNGASEVTLSFDNTFTAGVLSVDLTTLTPSCGGSAQVNLNLGDNAICSLVSCPRASVFVDDALLQLLQGINIIKVNNTITSDATIDNRSLLFEAGDEINLMPGFEVSETGALLVRVQSCGL